MRTHAALNKAERRRLRAKTRRAKPKTTPNPNRSKIKNDEFRAAVEMMTNKQRSAWARRGYPGLQHREVERIHG